MIDEWDLTQSSDYGKSGLTSAWRQQHALIARHACSVWVLRHPIGGPSSRCLPLPPSSLLYRNRKCTNSVIDNNSANYTGWLGSRNAVLKQTATLHFQIWSINSTVYIHFGIVEMYIETSQHSLLSQQTLMRLCYKDCSRKTKGIFQILCVRVEALTQTIKTLSTCGRWVDQVFQSETSAFLFNCEKGNSGRKTQKSNCWPKCGTDANPN